MLPEEGEMHEGGGCCLCNCMCLFLFFILLLRHTFAKKGEA